MALIKCPECHREISDKAAACPHCGCPGPHAEPDQKAPGQSQDAKHSEKPDFDLERFLSKPADTAGSTEKRHTARPSPKPPPQEKDRSGLRWLIIFAVLLGLFFAMGVFDEKPKSPSRIVPEDELAIMGMAIRNQGYSCAKPEKGLFIKDGPRGFVFRVRCENYKIFRVIVTDGSGFIVEPWDE